MHKLAAKHNSKYLANTFTYLDLPEENQQLSTCSVAYNPYKEIGIKCYVDSKYTVDGLNQMPIMKKMSYHIQDM